MLVFNVVRLMVKEQESCYSSFLYLSRAVFLTDLRLNPRAEGGRVMLCIARAVKFIRGNANI